MAPLSASLLLALLACVSASPLENRAATSSGGPEPADTPEPINPAVGLAASATAVAIPTSYAAFGDSFAAGIGAGKFLSSSADGMDNACARFDGSYPWQYFQFLEQHFGTFTDFFACSGDVLDGIDAQVAKLNGKKVDVMTLSISGNDFGFGNIVVRTRLSLLRRYL